MGPSLIFTEGLVIGILGSVFFFFFYNYYFWALVFGVPFMRNFGIRKKRKGKCRKGDVVSTALLRVEQSPGYEENSPALR